MAELRIGVIGYSAQDFDEQQAKQYIAEGLDEISANHSGTPVLVSGLTDLGIPNLAYREAANRGWKTVGIACSKASNFDCYPVDEKQIVGSDWGDESETFLSDIDVILRVGGGDQATDEITEAKQRGITAYEYDL